MINTQLLNIYQILSKKTINVYPTKMYEKYILLKFHFLKQPKPKQVCINETSENNLSYI